MAFSSKIDPYHANVIVKYLKTKEDFINFIQIKKQFKLVLDRIRINPIPITKETKNLFQFLNTQQIFNRYNNEIVLPNIDTYEINFPINYSEMLQTKNNKQFNKFKFKKIVYGEQEKRQMGNEIPKEVNVLGTNCFGKSNIRTIEIPSKVTEIKSSCFRECEDLEEIILPDSVITIGDYCFQKCTSLTKVKLSENLETLPKNVFEKCSSLKRITLPSKLKLICQHCFEGCDLSEIEFPESVEFLRNWAFNFCGNLQKVDLSKATKLTSLSEFTFDSCTKLTEVIFPSSLKRILDSCFGHCESLERIEIPSSVTFIGSNSFEYCKNLKELIILNDMCRIDESIIRGCHSLTKIIFPTINGYCSYNPPEEEEAEILKRNGMKLYFPNNDQAERNIIHSNKMTNNIISLTTLNHDNKTTSLYIPSSVTKVDHLSSEMFGFLEELILPSTIINIDTLHYLLGFAQIHIH